MTFGFGKIAMGGGGPAPSQPLTGFVSPSRISTKSSNGSWSSPFITCNASGGEPPYSYAWSTTEGRLTADDDRARVSISGYNDFKISQVKCTITDNDGTTKEVSMGITVEFGNGVLR